MLQTLPKTEAVAPRKRTTTLLVTHFLASACAAEMLCTSDEIRATRLLMFGREYNARHDCKCVTLRLSWYGIYKLSKTSI